jgi:rod shape determining protein RodA
MLHVEKSQGFNRLKHFDWLLLIIVLALNAYGMLMIRSVSIQLGTPGIFIKQGIGIGLGMVCIVILSLIDYKDLRILGFPVYWAIVVLLVLVLRFGIGKEETGSNAWLDLGPISFQPSELGKVAFVLIIALYLEHIVMKTGKYNYIKLMFFAALPVLLVLMQPDVGTVLVYGFIFLCMIFFAGLPYKYIFIGAGTSIGGVFLVYITGLYQLLPEHILNRFYSFFNKDADPLGLNYQVSRAVQHAGSGQLWGRGWGNGWAAKRVPFAHTDFIFSVVAEELGFFGAAVLILLFFLFFARCIYIAWHTRERYGSFIVMGLTAMFLAHFIENVGMNIGLLPVTGIPLPFISYGASSVVSNLISAGIILSISMHKERLMFE